MLVTLLLLSFLSFGLGFATHKHLNLRYLRRHPEPPLLDTPEHVLSYLEACSLDINNTDMSELFSEFRLFVNQKQLPVVSTVSEEKPAWYHSTNANIPPEQHWNMFIAEVRSEEKQDKKVEVLKSWLELGNAFTYKERLMLLEELDEQHRTEARKLFVIHTQKRKKKKTA